MLPIVVGAFRMRLSGALTVSNPEASARRKRKRSRDPKKNRASPLYNSLDYRPCIAAA
jgi:hypothetical protein